MKKFSLFLAICLLFSTSSAVYAFDSITLPEHTFDDTKQITESGTCGENATWTLSDGTFTVSGTGEMEDYYYSSDVPWYSSRKSISKVVIENGITTIGYGAFSGCSSLTSIAIPSSVTSIGTDAFSLCTGLTAVTIPSSVTTIGDWAFCECDNLLKITIPDSVTTIGAYGFAYCTGLTSVKISSSVASIGNDAFYNCPGLTSVTIPSSVTTIGGNAFGFVCLNGNYAGLIEGFTIYGEAGSAAETYANRYDFSFVHVLGVEFTNEQITVANGIATGIADETTIAKLKTMIKGSNYTVKDFGGNILSDDALIGTGTVITAENGDVIIIVIKSDTDGNGVIDSTDYTQIKKAFLETLTLEGVFRSAADTDEDGKISTTDYIWIKSKFLGKN